LLLASIVLLVNSTPVYLRPVYFLVSLPAICIYDTSATSHTAYHVSTVTLVDVLLNKEITPLTFLDGTGAAVVIHNPRIFYCEAFKIDILIFYGFLYNNFQLKNLALFIQQLQLFLFIHNNISTQYLFIIIHFFK
jgi:hypothetical protein